MKHKPLDEQVVFVAGASTGIGRATALTSPKLTDTFSRDAAFPLQRRKEPTSPTDSNSLRGPVEGDDRVHGVVGNTSR